MKNKLNIARPVRAMLLAAGYGTRLRPITNQIPKCLVEIQGKPLLGHWINKLEDLNLESIVINTHYLSEKVDKFLDKHFSNTLKIEKTYEKILLGTSGTLFQNINFFSGSIGMLIHADNYTKADISGLLKAHINRPSHCILTMLTFDSLNPSSCGIVELDENNVVLNLYEKVKNPPSTRANGAIYVFDDIFIEWFTKNMKNAKDFSTEVLPKLLGKIYTWHLDEPYLDIGTLESLQKSQNI